MANGLQVWTSHLQTEPSSMFRNRFRLTSLVALLVTSTVSTQHIFHSEAAKDEATAVPASDTMLSLNTTWQVLGPLPAGMRELPFGGFPASVSASYAELLDPTADQRRLFSTYGPINGTTALQTFAAQVQRQEPNHVQHSLTVEYPDVDWPWVRKSAGWSSLQWQMVAVTDLSIGSENTAAAITMDKTAEFAIVPQSDFRPNATMLDDTATIDWFTGDWYSYVAAFSRENVSAPELPISQHLLHLNKGAYKLLVRSMYEIRIFGDPKNGGSESPKMTLGIDIAVRGLDNIAQDELIEVHTNPHHSNVPHVVGGNIAGWGLSFAVRNLSPNDTYTLQDIDIAGPMTGAASPPLKAELGLTLSVAPGQTVLVPVKITQSSSLNAAATFIDLTLRLTSVSDPSGTTIAKPIRIPIIHKPAFWETSSSDDDHNAYMYSYLAPDHTVQLAAATPPRRANRALAGKGPLPPLILTLHGAGVDIRDLFFSNSIQKQNDSWSILPTGRTPWGYDWQLASLQAADAAVTAFHKHLYGLPANVSDEERNKWQFDPEKLFIMGHSNGGQGAWYRLARFPDRVIGGVVAAGYIKVSDYVSFAWKVGRHFTDPALQGLLHSSISMFENDLFASNLAGLDLLVKYGSADANVPPWNSKDMAMLVDGWNQRSGLVNKVKIAEVPGRPHWWDTLFSESDVQQAIEASTSSSKNPGYEMPDSPQRFTLTVANPAEAGSKGGWRISEIDVPGRLAKLEVRYGEQATQNGADKDSAHVQVVARNVRRIDLDMVVLRRSASAALLSNSTPMRLSLNGQEIEADLHGVETVHFFHKGHGEWESWTDLETSTTSARARPIGPVLRIVSSEGPMVIVVPSAGSTIEVTAWMGVARRFAADLLLYGLINSQIITDADFVSSGAADTFDRSNIVTLGGPHVNTFTRSIYDSWPTQNNPIQFPSPETSSQFEIQGCSFYEIGTAMLALAPHPTFDQGLVLIAHGVGVEGVSRAARLLPTRTATMIPEWIVVDRSAEWMGEGGVQAAGWYDRGWSWSESMSYVS